MEESRNNLLPNTPPKTTTRKHTLMDRIRRPENLLIILTLSMVLVGVALGFLLVKFAEVNQNTLELIMYPGELMMRLLKLIVLPLIVTSVIVGLAQMDPKTSGKLGARAIAYYLTTTAIAVVLGLVLVSITKPGRFAPQESCNSTDEATTCELDHSTTTTSTFDTVLDLGRNIVPDNIVSTTFEIVRTEGEIGDDGQVRKVQNKVRSTNVLGLISCSIVLGIALSKLGGDQNVKVLVQVLTAVNDALMEIVRYAIWTTPIGIASLVIGNIVKFSGATEVGTMISVYTATVLGGLVIHVGLILPAIFWIMTRQNPFVFYKGMVAAMVTAFGTGSSSATLPQTFKCLEGVSRVFLF